MVPDADDYSRDGGTVREPTPDPFRGEDGGPVVPDGWTHDTVDANGIEVSYYRAGPDADAAVATVVVAHGFFEDARCKQWLVGALADEGFDVVAFDARGHGHTDAPADGYAPADRVADMLGVVDALDIDDPVLYGHSMGGSTVAAAAAEHADRVRAVVMEDPAGMRWPPEFDLDEIADDLIEDVHEDLGKTFDELLAAYEDPDDDPMSAADEIPPELYGTFARSDQRQSEHVAEITRQGYPALDDVFPAIDVPALVLRRDHHETPAEIRDQPPTAERVQDLDLAESLPDGRLVHVPGAGHHVVLTARDGALAEIRAFLQHLLEGYDAADSGDEVTADHVELEDDGDDEGGEGGQDESDDDGPGLPSGPLSVTYRADGRPAQLNDRDESDPSDSTPEDWTAGTVAANGVDLAYYRTGPPDARTIVFAHGFSSDARALREHVAAFASDHDVVAYDARGHGHSAAPETGYRLADRVADLGGLLDALDLADVVLYGHSMGGSTVGVAAAEYPERVAGVVMEEPGLVHGWPADFSPEEFAEIQRADVEAAHTWPLEDLADVMTEDFPALFEGDPERAERAARAFHRTSTHAAQFALDSGDELGERLVDIDVPTLCLGGDWPAAWRADDLDTEARLPNGRYVHLPDAGHNAFLTAPDAATREIRTFLAQLEGE